MNEMYGVYPANFGMMHEGLYTFNHPDSGDIGEIVIDMAKKAQPAQTRNNQATRFATSLYHYIIHLKRH